MTQNDHEIISEDDLIFSQPIGTGAFGEVFLATMKNTGEKVAIKTVFQDRKYKNRELSIMKELHHPNIVELKNYYYTQNENENDENIYLNCIMDYVPKTLSDMIASNRARGTKFHSLLLKSYSYQLLKSIGYLHSLNICHRDIKPENVLIDPKDHTLKICDFGCAKHLNKNETNISYICSRYYRPPELVLGATIYTTQVDVWSVGCIIGEMVLNKPIFPGKSAKDQLFEIIKVLGSPKKDEILKMNNEFKGVIKLPNMVKKPWKDVFKDKIVDENFIDLVDKLIVYDPEKRLTPYKALCHPYFDELKKKETKLIKEKIIPKHLFEFQECEINFDKEDIENIISQVRK